MTGRRVRVATPADALEIRRIVDGAMLEVGDVEARIDADDVLVATEERSTGSEETRRAIVGAIVLDPANQRSTTAGNSSADADDPRTPTRGHARDDGQGCHVQAIAVRTRARGRGIGTALIEVAFEREGALTANFDADLRPFYRSLGFEIEPLAEGRCRGSKRLESDSMSS
ncbi:GNAT family N-acetyltransferase [Natrialbaceae archaeon A-CW3]